MSAEQDYQEKAADDAFKTTLLENELLEEKSHVAIVKADKKTTLEEARNANASNSPGTSNERLAQDMTVLRNEMDSVTLAHLEESKQCEIATGELTYDLPLSCKSTCGQPRCRYRGENDRERDPSCSHHRRAIRLYRILRGANHTRRPNLRRCQGQRSRKIGPRRHDRSCSGGDRQPQGAHGRPPWGVGCCSQQTCAAHDPSTEKIAELQDQLMEQIGHLLGTIVSIPEELNAAEGTASLELDIQIDLLVEGPAMGAAGDHGQPGEESDRPTESLKTKLSEPTATLVEEGSCPWNETTVEVEHQIPATHAATNIGLEEASQTNNNLNSEHPTFDVVRWEFDTRPKKENPEQTVSQENNRVPVIRIALPMSPPITPLNTSKAPLEVDLEDGRAPANVAPPSSSSDLWEPTPSSGSSTPCLSPARSQLNDISTSGPSRPTLGSEARTTKPWPQLFPAIRAANASTRV